jgi:hypothetical protein
MLTLLSTLATASGTLAAFLPALQIREMRALRSSRGVSVPFVCGIMANLAIWTAYGATLHQPVMVFTCGVSFLTNGAMLLVVVGLRRRHERGRELDAPGLSGAVGSLR